MIAPKFVTNWSSATALIFGLLSGLFLSALFLGETASGTQATPGTNPKNEMSQFSEYGFSPRTPKNQAVSKPGAVGAEAPQDSAKPSRRSRKAVHEKKPSGPLPERAATELVIRPEDRSRDFVPTAATVRSKVDEVANPVTRPSFLLGVSLQAYEPSGRALLQGAESTPLKNRDVKPMIALDLRWVPFAVERIPRTHFGLFGSLGYASHALDVTTPTGASIENATLTTFKTQLGGVAEWRDVATSLWNLRGQLGLGQFTASQSSSSSFASGTSSQTFASLGLFYDYLIVPSISISAGYEVRSPFGSESRDLVLQRHNFLVGVAGGFQ